MYSIVLLRTEPLHFTVLPISWFDSLDIVQIFNYGVSHTKLHRVFYSPNTEDEPNFKLDMQNIFDENTPANFMATIHSVWSSRDDAINHMGTRRHLLPAIYNANLELYHWMPADAADVATVKLQMEGLVWIRDMTINLLDADSEEENELEINDANGLNPIDPLEIEMSENELLTNGTDELEPGDVHLTEAKLEPNVAFPNMPNIIIDLTENYDLIRNVIAFSGSDQGKELDCHLNWVGDFPGPKIVKVENDADDHGSLAMANNIELINDGLLGKLTFQIDPVDNARLIALDGHIVKMPNDLYKVLLHFNEHDVYGLDYFDAKFVTVLAASYIRINEVTDGLIPADDIRMKLFLEIFRYRVKGDRKRMEWYGNYIPAISEWITGKKD